MYIKIEEYSDQVILFRPVHSPEVNITEVLLNNTPTDPCFDPHTIHSVRCALAKSYAVNLLAQGQIIKRTFHRSFPVPFYLPDGRVFVPLKMRPQYIPGDSSYGYVNVQAVKLLHEKDGHTYLHLINGQHIPLFTSINTARAILYLGHEFKQTYYQHEENEETVVLDAVRILLTKLSRMEKH